MTVAHSLASRLKDASLLIDKALIGDTWLDRSEDGRTFEVTNPATGEVLATLPDMTRAETAKAIDAAYVAQKAWRRRRARSARAFCAVFMISWLPMPMILRSS